jgi:hypothetical protein
MREALGSIPSTEKAKSLPRIVECWWRKGSMETFIDCDRSINLYTFFGKLTLAHKIKYVHSLKPAILLSDIFPITPGYTKAINNPVV